MSIRKSRCILHAGAAAVLVACAVSPVAAETLATTVGGFAVCEPNPSEPTSAVDICYIDSLPDVRSDYGQGGDTFRFTILFRDQLIRLGNDTHLSITPRLRKVPMDDQHRAVYIEDLSIALTDGDGKPTTDWYSLGSVDVYDGCTASYSCGYGLFPGVTMLDDALAGGVTVRLTTRGEEAGIGIQMELSDAAVRGGGWSRFFPSPLIFHTIGGEVAWDDYIDSTSITDANGNGSADLAILRRLSNDIPQVMIKDGRSGANVRFFSAHNSSWDPVAIAAIDVDLDGASEIAVLLRHRERGTVRVVIREARNGALVRELPYFRDGWQPQSLAIHDADGDGYDDVSVMAASERDRRHILVTRSGLTGEQLKWVNLR